MDGIIINDKIYKYIDEKSYCDCSACDLNKDDVCSCSMICDAMSIVKGAKIGHGVFKEMKVEK